MPDCACLLVELQAFLRLRLPDLRGRMVVAWSGGLDSTALLAALMELRQPGWPELKAVHVHHGLQPSADQWADHCYQQAERWGIELQVQRVQVASGASLEAQARAARQQALAAALQEGDVLLLAHHADDQAETVLFRLMRGTGLEGVAAMTDVAHWQVDGCFIPVWRPLLYRPRRELVQFVQARQLNWIEDPSNQDLQLARNFIRHRVMPLLQERWPQSVTHLVGFADEMAGLRQECRTADRILLAQLVHNRGLNRQDMAALPVGQQARLLRLWLQDQGLPLPGRSMLQRILRESLGHATSMQRWQWGRTGVMQWRGLLHPEPEVLVPRRWNPAEVLSLPDGRRLRAVERCGQGLLRPDDYQVTARQGGESLRLQQTGPNHALRTLWQSWGIAPLWRDAWPLLMVQGQLAAVPGLACAASFCTSSDHETGWEFKAI